MAFWEKVQQRCKETEDLLPLSATFLGLGLIRLWHLNLTVTGLDVGQGFEFNPVFRVASIVSLVVLALLAKRVKSYHRNGWFCLAAVLCMCLGALLLVLSRDALPWPALSFAGAVVSAFGYAALLLLWIELYGCLSSDKMVIAYSAANITAAVFWQVLASLGTLASAIVMVIIPAIATGTLFLSFTDPAASRESFLHETKDFAFPKVRSFWRLLVWVSCFSLVAGFFPSGNPKLPISLAYILTGLLVIIGIAALKDRFDSGILYRTALPFIVLGLVAAPFFGTDAQVPQLLISIGKELGLTVALVIACNIAYRHRFSAAYSAGLVYAANLLALFCGRLLRLVTAPVVQESHIALFAAVAVLCAVCVLTSTLVFNESHFHLHWNETELVTAQNREQHEAIEAAAKRISKEFKLSAREEEIILLLAQGRTYEEIGRELYISNGTVRAHVNHIFTKFDVHDKETLLAILRDRGLIMA